MTTSPSFGFQTCEMWRNIIYFSRYGCKDLGDSQVACRNAREQTSNSSLSGFEVAKQALWKKLSWFQLINVKFHRTQKSSQGTKVQSLKDQNINALVFRPKYASDFLARLAWKHAK